VKVAPLPAEDVVPEMLQVVGDWLTEIVDPTPEPGIPMPPAVDPITFATWTCSAVFRMLAASWNVAVAKVPLVMTLAFTPDTTHIVLPALLEHDTLLLAAIALSPGATFTLVTSEAE
jgi:hypothetical protein